MKKAIAVMLALGISAACRFELRCFRLQSDYSQWRATKPGSVKLDLQGRQSRH